MAVRSLLDAFFLMGPKAYDLMYRRGAPWERPDGHRELHALLRSGRLSPTRLAPGRALDLGCGAGGDSLLLARHGFDVTGVDFSPVAIGKARIASRVTPPEKLPKFVVADLLDEPDGEVAGPFDLIVDGGTLDDFPPNVRPMAAERVSALARPGSLLVMVCFYAPAPETPRFRRTGASRWGAPPVEPGEPERLFGEHWEIERATDVEQEPGTACFLMTRR